MNNHFLIELALSATGGAALGLIYFTGLWLTLRGLDPRRSPFSRLVISAGLRMGLVIIAAMLAIHAGADAQHILAALLGFLTIRQFFIVRIKNNIVPI